MPTIGINPPSIGGFDGANTSDDLPELQPDDPGVTQPGGDEESGGGELGTPSTQPVETPPTKQPPTPGKPTRPSDPPRVALRSPAQDPQPMTTYELRGLPPTSAALSKIRSTENVTVVSSRQDGGTGIAVIKAPSRSAAENAVSGLRDVTISRPTAPATPSPGRSTQEQKSKMQGEVEDTESAKAQRPAKGKANAQPAGSITGAISLSTTETLALVGVVIAAVTFDLI